MFSKDSRFGPSAYTLKIGFGISWVMRSSNGSMLVPPHRQVPVSPYSQRLHKRLCRLTPIMRKHSYVKTRLHHKFGEKSHRNRFKP